MHARFATGHQDIGTLTGGEPQLGQLKCGGIGHSVGRHARHRVTVEGEPEDVVHRGVHEPPPLRLTGGDVDRRVDLAVDQPDLTSLGGAGARGDVAIGGPETRRQSDDAIPTDVLRDAALPLGLSEERPEHATEDLLTGVVMDVRVVPVHALGGVAPQGDFVVEALPRHDMDHHIVGIAHAGDVQAVGVDIGALRQLVDQPDPEQVTRFDEERRTGHGAVEGEHGTRYAAHDSRGRLRHELGLQHALPRGDDVRLEERCAQGRCRVGSPAEHRDASGSQGDPAGRAQEDTARNARAGRINRWHRDLPHHRLAEPMTHSAREYLNYANVTCQTRDGARRPSGRLSALDGRDPPRW